LGPEDWQLYRRVRLDALKEAPYAFGSSYEAEVKAPDGRWRDVVTNRTRFVAEVDGAVAGTVSGGDGESRRAAAMTAMWVEPRFRRQGVGDLLVKTVVEWAQASGYAQMLLWVTDGNANAERLYERNGFRRTGAQQDVRPGKVEREMSRPL
jgi:GNAT superfamily N-acetyltransferase